MQSERVINLAFRTRGLGYDLFPKSGWVLSPLKEKCDRRPKRSAELLTMYIATKLKLQIPFLESTLATIRGGPLFSEVPRLRRLTPSILETLFGDEFT